MLSFQRLDVYRCSVDLLALVHKSARCTPRGHAALFDQLKRAATSISLNIAEAAGRSGAADAARAYAIARGSAMECAAVIDALSVLEVIDRETHVAACELIARVVAMLTKLCR